MKVIEVSLGYLTPYLKKEEDGGVGGCRQWFSLGYVVLWLLGFGLPC